MTTLGVVGSRSERQTSEVISILKQVIADISPEQVCTGDCRGVDTIASRFARRHQLPLLVFSANWKKYGKAAGPIRNSQIIKHSDILLALPGPSSRGTWDTIRKAKAAGITVIIK